MPHSFSITDVSKFARYINKTTDCWLWTGSKTLAGYGRIHLKGKNHYAHRLSVLFHTGKIDELPLDHLCRNRICVNPAHLEHVTIAENVKRGGKAITQCRNGHKYTDENTYIKPNGNRNCRTCITESSRRYRYATA